MQIKQSFIIKKKEDAYENKQNKTLVKRYRKFQKRYKT